MKKTTQLFLPMLLIFCFFDSVHAETQGFVKSTSLWQQTNIPVCWECEGYDTEK